MRYELLILFFFYLLFFGNTSAQNQSSGQPLPDYSFHYLDNTNGLLHNEVNAITQDGRGYIWLGTPKGLQRYDGLRLQHYSDSTTDLGESIIIAGLYADDSSNSIWLRTRDWEVKQFQWMNNKFIRHDQKAAAKVKEEKYTDWKGDAWLMGSNFMCETDKVGKTIKGYVMLYKPGMKLVGPAYMLKDIVSNKTWVSFREHELLLFDGNTKKIYSKGFNSLQDPLLQQFSGNSSIVWQMIPDSNKNIWLYSSDDLFYRYNTITKKLFTYSLQEIRKATGRKNQQAGGVTSIIEDNHGVIWIGTDNAGLLQFDSEKDNFNLIEHRQRNSPGINYTYTINFLFQDREENIWVGTDKGISIFNPYRQYFRTIRHEESNRLSLPKKEISAVIETSRGDVLIGTWGGGISVYDKQWRFKKTISFQEPDQNTIVSFLEDDDGRIWTGCQGGRLHTIDSDGLAIRSIHPAELENATVNTMTKDNKGNIWLGLSNGKIVKWDKEDKIFVRFNDSQQIGLLPYSPINNIFIDRSQNFWIASLDGFKHFDADKGVFTAVYTPQKNNTHSISGKHCFGIEEYSDSILLIGTGNGGLDFFNKNAKEFSQISIKEDGEIYSVFAIKKDSSGNIWFTTDYDIYKFEPAARQFNACKMEKGMINSFFRPNRFYITRSGQWLAWTFAEVLGFYPDSIVRQQNNIPPVTITGFKVFDKPIFIDTLLNSGQPIQLSHRQNFITIEFTSLIFLGASQIRYYYQLAGIDDDWVATGSNQFANYTKLEPGKYSFRVKTAPEGGSERITSFDIIISPPFWQTWWLRLAIILAIAGTIIFLVRRRINTIRHESQMKQRIAETEMMALRAQMNPHFIFNCLSAIDNLIQTNQQDKATTYLARFGKLIRSVLDSSKNNVVPFHRDFETLQLYLQMEQFRSNDKFSYKIEADPELLNTDYNVPPLIIQPFLENAIHHGLLNKQTADRKLDIGMRLKEDHILYTITDNGIGRQNAAAIKELNRPEHLSYGIQIIKDRVQLHNRNAMAGDIIITDLLNNGQATGTKVEVRIKINDTNT